MEMEDYPRASPAKVDTLLDFYGVEHIVVGHTRFPEIAALYGGKVLAIDARIHRDMTNTLGVTIPMIDRR